MQDVLTQAEEYRQRASQLNLGHYRATEGAERRHKWLGIAVVATAAIVSTSIFATLEALPGVGWKIAAGLVSMAAAVAAAVQTFLRFDARAAGHKAAAAQYGAIRRQLDLFLLRYQEASDSERGRALDQLQGIAEALSELAANSPYLSRELFRAGEREHERIAAE